MNNVVCIKEAFRKVDGLGAEILVALAIKGFNSPGLLARRAGLFNTKGQEQSLYEPVGTLGPEAPICLTQVKALANPGKRLWSITGTESRDIIFRDDIVVTVVSQMLIIFDTVTGKEIKRIQHPAFKLLHTVAFHPDPKKSNIVLVSSSGVDKLLEVNLDTGEVVYEWFAWEHGFNKNHLNMRLLEKGKPLPVEQKNVTCYSTDEYIRQFKNKRLSDLDSTENICIVVDTTQGDVNLGLETVFHTVHPNWAAYSKDGSKLLATFLLTGQAVEIDRATGSVRVILEGLSKPHGIIAYQTGYLISDSRHGRVLHLNQDYSIIAAYNFTKLPFDNGDNFPSHWIQHSYPINKHLIATVDSRRAMVFVWNPSTSEYSTYSYDPSWLVQAVLPVPTTVFNIALPITEMTRESTKHYQDAL